MSRQLTACPDCGNGGRFGGGSLQRRSPALVAGAPKGSLQSPDSAGRSARRPRALSQTVCPAPDTAARPCGPLWGCRGLLLGLPLEGVSTMGATPIHFFAGRRPGRTARRPRGSSPTGDWTMTRQNWWKVAVPMVAVARWRHGRCHFRHCEIPCGIYDDPTGSAALKSTSTISRCRRSSPLETPGPQPDHAMGDEQGAARRVQHIVTQYFMTQRLAAPAEDDQATRTRAM